MWMPSASRNVLMFFSQIIDDQIGTRTAHTDYRSPIPEFLNGAPGPPTRGHHGTRLLAFITTPSSHNLRNYRQRPHANRRRVVRDVFEDATTT